MRENNVRRYLVEGTRADCDWSHARLAIWQIRCRVRNAKSSVACILKYCEEAFMVLYDRSWVTGIAHRNGNLRLAAGLEVGLLRGAKRVRPGRITITWRIPNM